MASMDQYSSLRNSEFSYGSFYILINDKYVTHANLYKFNTRSKRNEVTHHCIKGTLLLEVLTDADYGSKILCKHAEEEFYFHVGRKDVVEITENVFDLLIAIPYCKSRIEIFHQPQRLADGLEMDRGTVVSVKLPNVTGEMQGVIRYKGKVYDKDGIHFGIELFNAEGRGNTDGTCGKKLYFHCEPDGGVFLPLNRVQPFSGVGRAHSPVNAPKKSKHSRMFSGASSSRDTCPTTMGISKDELATLEVQHGSEVYIFTEVRGKESQEKGKVKFIGRLQNNSSGDIYVGIDLDKPVGNGTGLYNGKHLFYTRQNHAALVPLSGVLPVNTHDIYQRMQFNSSPGASHSKIDLATHLQKSFIHQTSHSSPSTFGPRVAPVVENGRDHQKSLRRSARHRNSPQEPLINFQDSAMHAQPPSRRVVSGRPPIHRNITDNNSDDDMAIDLYSSHNSAAQTDTRDLLGNRAGSPSMNDLYRPSSDTNSLSGYPQLDPLISNPKTRTNRSAPGKFSGTKGRPQEVVKLDFINSDLTNIEGQQSSEMEVGDMVEISDAALKTDDEIGPTYGVIKWIEPTHSEERIAGVELERPSSIGKDGYFRGHKRFQCDYGRGHFVYLKFCKKDSRFSTPEPNGFGNHLLPSSSSALKDFGDFNSPQVGGIVPAPYKFGRDMIGKKKGIQGHHNSCYLDSTLFSLFAYSDVLDTILFRKRRPDDLPEYEETQKVLKEMIINPLRKHNFVRADRIMQLRELLDKLGSVSGLVTEEKDPEEFLNTLLMQVFKADPLHELRQGDSNAAHEGFFYQIFTERDEKIEIPNTQQLLEKSLISADLKFRTVPVCLILQMPRFGKDYKMYRRLRPSLELDITDLVEDIPRSCDMCESYAEYECQDCFLMGTAQEFTYTFCKECANRYHSHRKRKSHRYKVIKLPDEFRDWVAKKSEHGQKANVERQTLDLFAVVCIATSHYVSFAKCGNGKDSTWVFFDSMADRVGEQSGYNIPEITHCPDVEEWLSLDEKAIDKEDEKLMPELKRRLLCDSYMCMYQSRELMSHK